MERSQMSQEFGRRIRAAREARHLTLEELSVATQLAVSTLGRIERGQRLPQAHTVMALASALDIPVEELAELAGLEINPAEPVTSYEFFGKEQLRLGEHLGQEQLRLG